MEVNRTHVGANVTLETVLVHFVMFKSLRPMKVAVAVAAAESLDVVVRQQVPLKLVRSGELAHAAQEAAKRALESLR